jgi:hypothetical protein
MASAVGAKPASTSSFPAVRAALEFLSRRWLAALLASAALLIPCFWHRHIQATDLGSHVYNAWLAQLIEQGKAPGLKIVPETSNFLFDLILGFCFNHYGALAAERIAVSFAILVFFWGAFALCSAAARRAAWSVVPLLAMASYGFIFNMGFFNMYLAAAFALWAMAIVWRGARWDFLLLIPLLGLAWMAHLMGVAGFLALGGFLLAMRLLSLRGRLAVTALYVAGYAAALWYVRHHFALLARQSDVYWMAGADQFAVDGGWFTWIAMAALAAVVVTVLLQARRGEMLRGALPWLLAYAVAAVVSVSAPGGIWHPRLHSLGYLPDRASLYTAVLLCCLVAAVRPARWQVAAFAALAVAFCALLYRDTLRVDRMETRVEAVVRALPAGSRVVATFFAPPGARLTEQHFADRACVGHCFFVGNYEPSSRQFRIRAAGPNRVVAWRSGDAEAMQRGRYMVKPEDLPLTEIYACGPQLGEVCAHPLAAGEENGRAARQP